MLLDQGFFAPIPVIPKHHKGVDGSSRRRHEDAAETGGWNKKT